MGRMLEYAGLPNVWEDLPGFVEWAGKAHPRIKSQIGLSQLVARHTVERQQRHPWSRHIEFGADILSDEHVSLPAFQYFTVEAMEYFQKMPREQRLRLIELPELENTYIWNHQNSFLQELTDHDFRVVMMSHHNVYFRVPDIQGPFVETRAYDGYGMEFERIATTSWEEGNRVIAERKSRNYVNGADLAAVTQE
jgi:hypothetical protein